MTYKELKEFIETLNEDQLKQQIAIWNDNETVSLIVDRCEISEEDTYWEHCDCYGNEKMAKAYIEGQGDKWEDEKDNFTVCPKGTITLYVI